MQASGMNDDGTCPDCGAEIPIGAWPFPCAGSGHILYMRLAFMPSGRTVEYAPPQAINPIDKPQVTRDWMDANGNLTPMEPGSWDKNNLPDFEPGVKHD